MVKEVFVTLVHRIFYQTLFAAHVHTSRISPFFASIPLSWNAFIGCNHAALLQIAHVMLNLVQDLTFLTIGFNFFL